MSSDNSLTQGGRLVMRFSAICWLFSQWWHGLFALAGLLICSCATPALLPVPDRSAKPPGDTSPASEAIERNTTPQPDAYEYKNINKNPRQQREQLERRMQAVVTCLESARQVVVAAEVAGAGIEAVRPAIDALNRSESALREAQTQLILGDASQAVSPLGRAEAACREAREFSQQT